MNMPPLDQFKRLDVRPLFKRGEEPRAVILQRVQKLAAGEGLVVLAPFLPSPLIELLQSEGFESKVEPSEKGTWAVYFWKRSG